MTIDEIKERLNRKFAYDYEIARSLLSSESPSTEELETTLAESESRLPRLDETWTSIHSPYRDGECEEGGLVCLVDPPPEEETYLGKGYWAEQEWKDKHGKVWFYHGYSGHWISRLNLMAYVRALRDELAYRRGREFTHDQFGYDS
jgi:hypothetical protein